MNSYSDSEDSLDNAKYNSEVQARSEREISLNIKKFICEPNPLMQKVQFFSYDPVQHYPIVYQKLPDILNTQAVVKIDPNNMQLIQQSAFRHQKMKRDALKVMSAKSINNQIANKNLPTMDQFYEDKMLVYDKFGKYDSTIIHQPQEQRLKKQQFGTYVMDLCSIIKKQNKNCQTASITLRSRQKVIRSQASSRNNYRHKIQFSSNFQSGNLFRVYQKQYNQYDLVLQNDINTKGNNQWFFFSVKGATKGTTLKFNIVNLSKKDSLFEQGMKPTVFSMVRFEKRKIGWVREGTKISYDENASARRQTNPRPYYCLSFEYKFTYDGDVVYFSHSYPYTLTDLSKFLSSHLSAKAVHKYVKFRNLASTLGGNDVDMLEISNEEQIRNSSKKVVWILGRQHPGEVTASFMMQGVINFLLSGDEQAQTLSKNFLFKIVPMVNVDGVIHGNSRAQIIGCDPNRKWSDPHKNYNPVIYVLKKMIQKDKDRIQMVLDLHSHSRKFGTFFYGNNMSQMQNRNVSKVFPAMVCKNDERFTLKSCRFGGGTNLAARKILFDIHKIPLIYTIQSSFYGYQKDDYRIIPYYPQDYKEMAQTVLKTFSSYMSIKYQSMNPDTCLRKKFAQDQLFSNIDRELQERMQRDSEGSDSNPSQDEFTQKQLKKLLPKTFDIKKTKKKSVVRHKKKVNDKKQNKDQVATKQMKGRKIQKESHYKKFFSSRNSQVQFTPVRQSINKQTRSYGTQVDIEENKVLRQSMNGSLSQKKVSGGSGALCILGKKLEQQLSIFGNCVGVQVDMRKQFTKNRNDFFGSVSTRRSFKLPHRPSSILQIKENNFLNRGLGNTLTGVNFFNSRR